MIVSPNSSKSMEDMDRWVQTANKGERVIYYKGFFIKESVKDFNMRRFSKYLNRLSRTLGLITLYQKKISDFVYEYTAEKL